MIASCRRRGIDPQAYLREVLTRLANLTNHQVPEATPAAWAKARQQEQTPTLTAVLDLSEHRSLTPAIRPP